MLVLSRKRSESIQIGREISVIIAGVGSQNVRLDVEAHRELRIWREESTEPPDFDATGAKAKPAADATEAATSNASTIAAR